MPQLFAQVREIVSHWASREERFLRRQFLGKTAGVRVDGLRRSKRNEAKYLLLAIAPMALIGPLIGKWSDASLFGKTVLALLAVWCAAVLLTGGFLLFRALIRVSKRRSG
jgi:hypothetical protein